MGRFLATLFCAASLTAGALAQPSGPPVRVTVAAPKSVVAWKEFTVTVSVALPDGWHAYGINPKRKKGEEEFNTILGVTMVTNKWVDRFMPKAPAPAAVPGKNEGEYIHEGVVKFPVTLRVKPGTKTAKIKLNVTHQICDSSTCLPPKTESVEFVVNVMQKAAR